MADENQQSTDPQVHPRKTSRFHPFPNKQREQPLGRCSAAWRGRWARRGRRDRSRRRATGRDPSSVAPAVKKAVKAVAAKAKPEAARKHAARRASLPKTREAARRRGEKERQEIKASAAGQVEGRKIEGLRGSRQEVARQVQVKSAKEIDEVPRSALLEKAAARKASGANNARQEPRAAGKEAESSLSAKWAGLDSNQRRRKPADLQSAPFGHFGTYPRAGKASVDIGSAAPSRKCFAGGSSAPSLDAESVRLAPRF